MIVSRIISIILRLAQFFFAAIVLGLSSWFLWQHEHNGEGIPFARTIYVVVVSALAVLVSLFSMIPTKSSIASYGTDLFFMVAWFVRTFPFS